MSKISLSVKLFHIILTKHSFTICFFFFLLHCDAPLHYPQSQTFLKGFHENLKKPSTEWGAQGL